MDGQRGQLAPALPMAPVEPDLAKSLYRLFAKLVALRNPEKNAGALPIADPPLEASLYDSSCLASTGGQAQDTAVVRYVASEDINDLQPKIFLKILKLG